ncbi:hypothetical protein GIB67_026812 [Kingdonia uniflora]|uniref:Pentatricopeptide repeat-containing protein n=1 Tax=Kingdonia uniflora TaxID=39325 RepID=A0A7J7MHI6_9MAGN|nr:hypothetical protein GIB67_026812 [Kingdonia uniflora]
MTQQNVVAWNSMLAMYLRLGCVDEAQRIFDFMPERNGVSWTTMIAGCMHSGKSRQVLALYHQMCRARVEVDEVTMVAILFPCANLGDLETGRWIHSYVDKTFSSTNQLKLVSLNNVIKHMYARVIEEAYRVFKKIKRRSIASWTTVITGLQDEAYELIGTMSLKPNEAVWGALLGGYRIHRNIKLASYVCDNLISKLKPIEAAIKYFTLLSNAYASADRWVDVTNVRQKMVEIGVKKPPGHSQIQVNGVIH